MAGHLGDRGKGCIIGGHITPGHATSACAVQVRPNSLTGQFDADSDSHISLQERQPLSRPHRDEPRLLGHQEKWRESPRVSGRATPRCKDRPRRAKAARWAAKRTQCGMKGETHVSERGGQTASSRREEARGAAMPPPAARQACGAAAAAAAAVLFARGLARQDSPTERGEGGLPPRKACPARRPVGCEVERVATCAAAFQEAQRQFKLSTTNAGRWRR